METIPLTQGYSALVDDEDYHRVSQFKWCIVRSGLNVYACTTLNKKQILLHRFLLNLKPSIQGTSSPVDHINQDSLDNRKENLRVTTVSINSINSKPQYNSRTQITGVRANKSSSKFRAHGCINGNKQELYYGKDFFEACCTRKSWEANHGIT